MATAAVMIPSHLRCEPGSVNVPVGTFPKPTPSPPKDVSQIADEWASKFNQALSKADPETIASLFLEDSYWRDHLALSWDYHTATGRKGVREYLDRLAKGDKKGDKGIVLESVTIDKSTAHRAPHVGSFDLGEVKGVESYLTFKTKLGSGRGLVRLSQQGDGGKGDWKIFNLFTTLEELDGNEEATGARRPNGVEHGGKPDRKNWADRRKEEEEGKEGEDGPVVLIVGAGQAGLTIAARLKMLDVPALIIDQNENVGDNWRKRYHQLVLHDPVWYDHLPYIPFPAGWPVFTPKDKLGSWFQAYASALELNVWMRTSIVSSSYDEASHKWTVKLDRKSPVDGTTQSRTLHPKHVIQATGHSGKANFPSHIKGLSNFKGDRLCHSSEFTGAKQLKGASGGDGKKKKVIIVGCCNSGHDISQDFYEKGYDVTMVQRSSTCVVSSESITKIALSGLYDEGGPPCEDGDIWVHGTPAPILKAIQIKVTELQGENDKEILEGLEKVGFKLDKGPDGAGLFMKYFQRGGGYYIDVGASKLIAEGKIGIKQGQEIEEVLSNGLRFADGSELEADEVGLLSCFLFDSAFGS